MYFKINEINIERNETIAVSYIMSITSNFKLQCKMIS